MRVEAILLCDKLWREDNGKIHLSGIFGRIWAQSVPAVHQEMYLYFQFIVEPTDRRDEGQDELTVSIADPTGARETMPSLPVVVRGNGKVEGTIKLQAFPLRDWGPYKMIVSFNDEEVGFCTFECANPANTGDSNVTVH